MLDGQVAALFGSVVVSFGSGAAWCRCNIVATYAYSAWCRSSDDVSVI